MSVLTILVGVGIALAIILLALFILVCWAVGKNSNRAGFPF